MVVDLARWRNQVLPKGALGPAGRVIPERIIIKPPTAELKHDQKDEDTLPPYPVLDDILKGLVEGEESVDAIVQRGHDRDLVNLVWRLLAPAAYKPRPGCPGGKRNSQPLAHARRDPPHKP